MDDQKLFEYYLLTKTDGNPWNLSPGNLYIELETREFVKNQFELFNGMNVCNIGIGAGEWDDYLGYCLEGKGSLTSIDIDKEICETLSYRQKRENHPNPSSVLCEDILRTSLQADSFNLITIIGSTINEIGEYDNPFRVISDLLKPGGMLLYMDFIRFHPFNDFARVAEKYNLEIILTKEYERFENLRFYISKAIKR